MNKINCSISLKDELRVAHYSNNKSDLFKIVTKTDLSSKLI